MFALRLPVRLHYAGLSLALCLAVVVQALQACRDDYCTFQCPESAATAASAVTRPRFETVVAAGHAGACVGPASV